MEIGQHESAVELLEPIPDERRVTIDYRHVEAWVPTMVGKGGGLFPGLSLPTLDLAKWGRKLRGKDVERNEKDRLENGKPDGKAPRDRKVGIHHLLATPPLHPGSRISLLIRLSMIPVLYIIWG